MENFLLKLKKLKSWDKEAGINKNKILKMSCDKSKHTQKIKNKNNSIKIKEDTYGIKITWAFINTSLHREVVYETILLRYTI